MATQPTALGRVSVRDHATHKPRGCKRPHLTLAERVARHRDRPEALAMVPPALHTLRRVLEGRDPETVVEARLARAFSEDADRSAAERVVAAYVEAGDGVGAEVAPRAFAYRPPDLPVLDEEWEAVAEDIGARPRDGGPCCCDEGPTRPDPAPPLDDFRVTHAHLYCVDESNPEWAGDDEPYVVFAITTEEQVLAGRSAWSARTPVYEGDDATSDGDRRPRSGDADIQLYGPVAPRAVTSPAVVAATCFEHDNGDPDSIADELRASLTTIATTAAGIGGPAGWIVAGAAGIGVAITFLVDLWASDDQIGDVQTFAFTESDAAGLTATNNPNVLAPLHFDGGGGDGIYDAYLKIERA